MSRRGSLAGSACMDFPLRGRTQVDNSLSLMTRAHGPSALRQPLIKGSGRCFLRWMKVLLKLFDAVPGTSWG